MGFWQTEKNTITQSTTSPLFQYFGMRELKNDITLTSPISIDDDIINVNAGHGFQVGDCITVWENNAFEQSEVIAVNVNAITIELPSAGPFTTGATVVRGNCDFNVNGSSTPVDFYFKMYQSWIPIDIQYVVFELQSGNNVPDDGKFAGITALTNGMYIRHKNGSSINFGNYKTNLDFKLRGADVNYTQKAPAGTYATEIIVNITKSFGQVVRVNPRTSDYILLHVRDDLSPTEGLSFARISLLGSYTEGE